MQNPCIAILHTYMQCEKSRDFQHELLVNINIIYMEVVNYSEEVEQLGNTCFYFLNIPFPQLSEIKVVESFSKNNRDERRNEQRDILVIGSINYNICPYYFLIQTRMEWLWGCRSVMDECYTFAYMHDAFSCTSLYHGKSISCVLDAKRFSHTQSSESLKEEWSSTCFHRDLRRLSFFPSDVP